MIQVTINATVVTPQDIRFYPIQRHTSWNFRRALQGDCTIGGAQKNQADRLSLYRKQCHYQRIY